MSRIDRLLTIYYFNPLRRLALTNQSGIPILMYHSISSAEERVHPYYRINTLPEVFADQMRFLARQGYKTIGLEELTAKEPDGKSVVITFDDGYSDFYFKAFPILERYGFRATVFLATAYVEGEPFSGRPCLTWKQIRELSGAGIAFGSHTHTHPQLRNLERPAIVQELKRSKEIIEDRLGSAVAHFSYPYRFPEEDEEFKSFIAEELINAGYIRGVTTVIGRYRTGDNQMLIKRLPINSEDDETFFDAKLEGSYDWLRTPQYLVKRLRSIVS
ncbi:MAG: NodB homology domain-containing protein [Nitrospira sp.]|nr:MAG: NodB homology domain-containing protein [Nitrospira sp.]